MAYWAVVQAEQRLLTPQPQRRETLAEHLFKRHGFESYLPRIKIRQAGRLRIAPLFPSYIFVRVVSAWYPLLWTEGDVRILMSGDQPAHLPENVMDSIRRREVGGFVRLPPAQRALRIGQRVRVLSGQFRGHVGLYDGQSAHERERILLDLLGRSVRVELAKGDQIEPLPLA